MPLPGNGTLSLQGHSRPGDPMHSKPKQAMIVRMSTETLDALEAFPQHPQMDFEFGDKPGIYIGDTYFPMRPLKEGPEHELYLRTYSAAKPMAPLKLYANVTGKFTVERELGQDVQDKVRDRTQLAERTRQERKVIVVDTPPEVARPPKRKKPAASMFRPSDISRTATLAVAAPVPPRVSPVPPSLELERHAPVVKRIIHTLAVAERTAEEVIAIVAPSCDDGVRQELLAMMETIAEPLPQKVTDKGPKIWRLLPKSWLEVRPYEWPTYTAPERTNVARAARWELKGMGIPEKDPVWRHVQYRNVNSDPLETSALKRDRNAVSATAEAPKRGVSSVEVKQKKTAKAKPDAARAKAPVAMKDESVKPTPPRPVAAVTRMPAPRDPGSASPNKIASTSAVPSTSTTTAASTAAARRQPGSGFRVAKSASSRSGTVDEPSPSPAPAAPRPAGKPVDVRKTREPPAPSGPARPAPPIPPPAQERKAVAAAQPGRIKKVRESVGVDSDRERDRDVRGRDREDRERERDRDRDRDADRDRERKRNGDLERDKERPRPRDLKDKPREREVERRPKDAEETRPTVAKRKVPREVDDEEAPRAAPLKKRRVDEGARQSDVRESRGESSLPRKPEQAAPRMKPSKSETPAASQISKDASPLPPRPRPSAQSSARPSAGPSVSTSNHGAAREREHRAVSDRSPAKTSGSKSRRHSIAYTSSEDEGEIRRPAKRDTQVPTPPTTTQTTPTYTAPRATPQRPRVPRPLPTDHAGLRARYDSSYLEYITLFQKVFAQKRKIESLLKNSGSVGSVTDSDGDVELLDVDELKRLTDEHQQLHEELEGIRQVFASSGKSVPVAN